MTTHFIVAPYRRQVACQRYLKKRSDRADVGRTSFDLRAFNYLDYYYYYYYIAQSQSQSHSNALNLCSTGRKMSHTQEKPRLVDSGASSGSVSVAAS